jgi:hypothetical protein
LIEIESIEDTTDKEYEYYDKLLKDYERDLADIKAMNEAID